GYGRFEEWQEEILDLENTHRTKLDRRIRTETLWSREGISARRKRNQGRLKALEILREKRAEFAQRETTFSVNINQPKSDTQMILEAFNIDKSLGGKEIIRDFSLRVLKGDRIAIVGPNGAGKSTLLKSLTKEIGVDRGKVRLGYNFDLAAMWQDRTLENLNISVQEFLVGKGANTRDQPDQVIFQGRGFHIISYIKKFQFEYWKAKSPLKSLSGGELGRILLAKIFLRESNFLALDEPTNDLDVETLDMLKEILANYKGTVAFVSHDRDFIDNVANITIAYEGNGKWQAYSGGWSDYLKQKKNPASIGNTSYVPTAKIQKKKEKTAPKSINGNLLSFTERHRLEILPDLIESKEARISELMVKLEEPDLYSNNSSLFDELTTDLVAEQAKLISLEEEWYQLASRLEE
ncbi:MAG: ATP-binding cassette domain-containing protein, partial [Rhodobacteraceae bacterium]|nr:ATP-binding cassette domain-containing protein [Paracoccaceae bacterium]